MIAVACRTRIARVPRRLESFAVPSAAGPHLGGGGFWPLVKVERPTGRTTLTRGQVPPRLAQAGGGRAGPAASRSLRSPPEASGCGFGVSNGERV